MRYIAISLVGGAVAVSGNATQKTQRTGILHEFPFDWLTITYMDMLTVTAAVVGIAVGLLGIWKHFMAKP